MGMKDDEPAAKSKSEVLQEKPPESHSVSSSTKQNSIFSLTVNEFEGRSGKSFGSMNIDELLNSIWSVEGNQIPSNSIENEVVTNKEEANVVVEGNLLRHGSFSIPTLLYNKTVDEVWEEIQRNQSPQRFPNVIRSHDLSDCQASFVEMTLEDFLIKVGVIQEASDLSTRQKIVDHPFQNQCGNFGSNNNSCLDPRIEGAGGPVMGLGFCHPNSENNFMGNGSSSYQMFTTNGFFVGESSTNIGNGKSNGEIDVEGEPGSKPRKKNGSMELAVERRQRRMIKNRESAARSRARKQAYTVELEMKLNQLREENARLKRILAKAENKPKAEAEDENMQNPETEELKVKPSTERVVRTSKKFKTVRRTSSSAW